MAKLKLEPRDSYRGMDTLCRQFPEKTGKEIMELYEHDLKCHRLWIERGQEKIRAFAKRVNDAGAIYYRGRFGLDQRYFYKVSNVEVSDRGDLYADVEKIVTFMGDQGSGKAFEGRIHIEYENEGHTSISNYSLENEKEVPKEQWDAIYEYLNATKKFWEDIEWNI